MTNSHNAKFQALIAYLCRIPAVEHNNTPSLGLGSGEEAGGWWVKFSIDVEHPLAWNVIQELSYVLNSLSVNERLPTMFKPVSPPPYLNGGPKEYLSWVIECVSPTMSPNDIAGWLEEQLPKPVNDLSEWSIQTNE